MEADEPSLYSRRKKLSLQYAIRLAANLPDPSEAEGLRVRASPASLRFGHAHEISLPPKYVNLYENKHKSIKSF